MKKKITIIGAALILTVIAFTGLYLIQKKLLHPSGTEKVYVANQNIDDGQVFEENDIDKFFNLENRDKNTIVDGGINKKSEIINTYTHVKLNKNEQLSKSKLGDNKKRVDIDKKRIINLNFADISDIVGGILKKGDTVDIMLTEDINNSTIVKTKTILQGVYVDEVFGGDGNIIDRNSGSKTPATRLNLILSAENGHRLENALNSGKIKLMKVIDHETEYNDITIENNK